MTRQQKQTTYWAGYLDSPIALDPTGIPKSMGTVILAFGGPNPDGSLDMSFFLGKHAEKDVLTGIRVLKARGTTILLSLLDRPETHWDAIDLDAFARDVAQTAKAWGIDGVDIDAESGITNPKRYVDSFVALGRALRSALPPSAPISYTCYLGAGSLDGQIIPALLGSVVDYVQLMAYFDDADGMKALFEDYATLVPPRRLLIGDKAGGSQGTPLAEVKALATWVQARGAGGMMLWTINRDEPGYTGLPVATFAATIAKGLMSPGKELFLQAYSVMERYRDACSLL